MPTGAPSRDSRAHGVADAVPFVERLMEQYGTAVGPGHFFDAPAHFRLGYGGETEKIRAGLERLSSLLADG